MTLEVRLEPVGGTSTTVIFRGLNRQCSATLFLRLLTELPPHVGRPVYDFVYVPWVHGGTTNIGLAFVNFETHEQCSLFLNSLRSTENRRLLSTWAIRSVGQAMIQGRRENLEAILQKRGRPGMTDDDKPLVFHEGRPVSLQLVLEMHGLAGSFDARLASPPRSQEKARPLRHDQPKGQGHAPVAAAATTFPVACQQQRATAGGSVGSWSVRSMHGEGWLQGGQRVQRQQLPQAYSPATIGQQASLPHVDGTAPCTALCPETLLEPPWFGLISHIPHQPAWTTGGKQRPVDYGCSGKGLSSLPGQDMAQTRRAELPQQAQPRQSESQGFGPRLIFDM
mmetsp:Transcript_30867/g.71321  ORF Transcript_30867/g.71321 Transcript_30867/m.71321 type:complete len:337 (+) Transcript_30867:2-1012(+)